MRPLAVKAIGLIATLVSGVPAVLAAEPDVTAADVVGALEATFGVHPGERRNHIKGTCAVGEFVGSSEAAAYTRSALFSGTPVPVVARFSLAGGNPTVPDTARNARGMALELRLQDGQVQHMTMLNTPVFGAVSPQSFRDMIVALRPDPATGKPDPRRLEAYKASHPDNLAQAQFLDRNNPPASYASSSYFGIHTFRFVNKDNRTTLVRWQFVPQDGEKRLSDAEMKTAAANFLEQALMERVAKSPARWDMVVTIGEPGDPENNPTLAWSDARRKFKAGTLTITKAMPQKGAECERINYDPLVMADGIAPTDDPVLRFRSPAYAVSFAKRLGGL